MGVRLHQTHAAHFAECAGGLSDTLQMSHKETSRTTDEFISFLYLMQDRTGQTGLLTTRQYTAAFTGRKPALFPGGENEQSRHSNVKLGAGQAGELKLPKGCQIKF
jgi:hypothetical protein